MCFFNWPKRTLLVLMAVVAVLIVCSGKSEKSEPFDVESINVDEFFKDTEGTFILKDAQSGKMFVYNQKRAAEPFPPQSTFKILNSLVGLEENAVRDEYDIKRWDGVNRPISSHNQDHTLGSSMRYSVVWYYQAMAKDIGEERMRYWLDNCSYGNRDISGGIDKFWLSSSLKISPLEQIAFLEKFYNETLPFNNAIMKTVKRIMVQLEGNEYILYGKTGSSKPEGGLAMGWYVGFIVVRNHPFIFVTNIDTRAEIGGGPEAKEITIKILKKYGLLP